jgi:hypothetical protein
MISYEVLAQLSTPDIMRMDRTYEVAKSSIFGAVGRMPTVNYSRYMTLAGHDVLRNTAIVACGKFKHSAAQLRELDFGLSLAATP